MSTAVSSLLASPLTSPVRGCRSCTSGPQYRYRCRKCGARIAGWLATGRKNGSDKAETAAPPRALARRWRTSQAGHGRKQDPAPARPADRADTSGDAWEQAAWTAERRLGTTRHKARATTGRRNIGRTPAMAGCGAGAWPAVARGGPRASTCFGELPLATLPPGVGAAGERDIPMGGRAPRAPKRRGTAALLPPPPAAQRCAERRVRARSRPASTNAAPEARLQALERPPGSERRCARDDKRRAPGTPSQSLRALWGGPVGRPTVSGTPAKSYTRQSLRVLRSASEVGNWAMTGETGRCPGEEAGGPEPIEQRSAQSLRPTCESSEYATHEASRRRAVDLGPPTDETPPKKRRQIGRHVSAPRHCMRSGESGRRRRLNGSPSSSE